MRSKKQWQKFWEDNKTFKTSEDLTNPSKCYILDMCSLSIRRRACMLVMLYLRILASYWHIFSRIPTTDERLQCSFTPMGWDAFGLPAEHSYMPFRPELIRQSLQRITAITFRRQIKELGLSYDWEQRDKYH